MKQKYHNNYENMALARKYQLCKYGISNEETLSDFQHQQKIKISLKKENFEESSQINISIVSYSNANKDKFLIYKENKKKSGIYCWSNIITKKNYIGSALDLKKRFSIYYSSNSLKRNLNKGSSIISNALLKYGYSNFNLHILEYCQSDILISREQYYIDLLKPEYNILKIAGSRLGTKHSQQTKNLLKIASTGRKHSEEAKMKMKAFAKLRIGSNTSFFGKKHKIETKLNISKKNSISIKIENIELGTFEIFRGNKKAAEYLNIGLSTLRRYKKLNKLVRNKYLISNI